MKAERRFMEAAIAEAKKAAAGVDYPIGCVVVRGREIVARGRDSLRSAKNPVLHAEVVALQEAVKKLDTPYLTDCIVYTTMEPCPMCAGAAIWARVKGIVFGARLGDLRKHAKRYGHKDRTFRTINMTCKAVVEKGDPRIDLVEGFMRQECAALFHLVK